MDTLLKNKMQQHFRPPQSVLSPLPFTNEVLNIIARHDANSFLDGYFGYHHISITLEDIYKITFVTN
jgi:hypothetical protein